jgi:response regulator RpfG family c-di-GMP phosphodiesterase
MICNTCGIKNKEENKFCINCGEELTETENISQNICSNCGTENDDLNKFCISCGHQLIQKPYRQKRNYNQKKKNKKQLHRESKNNFKRKQTRKFSHRKNLKLLWITVAVVIGSVVLASSFDLIFNKYPDKEKAVFEQKSTNPAVEAKVFEIASKFVCSCGSCNEESLEVCSCGRAIEERQFIRNYLEQNQKPEDIIVAVANRYGWIKAEFAANYNVDASKVWKSGQLEIPDNIVSTPSALVSTKAAFSDRYTIYSAFICPCGQCNKDELSECTCNHPGGAVEVKRFIDEKINENKYTINDIIELVDNKYGGKKI